MNDQSTMPTYIVAVSGGIDSVVLLHMIYKGDENLPEPLRSNRRIVVAHVDHGIRDESRKDCLFVEELARTYNFEFEYTELNLGLKASEEIARNKRYEFLEGLVTKYRALGIVTAHHKDDVLETAIINIHRGTGRKGLSSLRSTNGRIRPLLENTKVEIRAYAQHHKLGWVEDETNAGDLYLRNRVRKSVALADQEWKDKFANELQKIQRINTEVDNQIATLLQYKVKEVSVLSRSLIQSLDHKIACEFVYAFIRRAKIENVDKYLIERLVVATKAAKSGSMIDIDKNCYALFTKRSMRLIDRTTLKTLSV